MFPSHPIHRIASCLLPALLITTACGVIQGKEDDKSSPESPKPPKTETNLAEGCRADLKKSCDSLAAESVRLREARDKAAADGKLVDAALKNVELEKVLERLELLGEGLAESDPRLVETASRHAIIDALVKEPVDRSKLPNSAFCSVVASPICPRLVSDLGTLADGHAQAAEIEKLAARVGVNYRLKLLDLLKGKKADDTIRRRLDRAYNTTIGSIDRYRLTDPETPDTPPVAACKPSLEQACKDLEGEVRELRSKARKLLDEGDIEGANEASLQLSYKTELMQIYLQGLGPDSDEALDAQRRYLRLSKVVDAERPAYLKAEREEVQKVVDTFGELYIAETKNEAGESVWETVELKDRKPWAGYWYPYRHSDMFEGPESPLQKFDAILAAIGQTPGAAVWERQRQRAGQPWESSDGLCDAWAIASSITKEPTGNRTIYGVELTPAQIKGLLVQKYANFRKERFGIPYQGYLDTDGLGQDLRPEAFHQLVKGLLTSGTAPIVDTDPNFPIWNMPLYRYDWQVVKDPERENAFLVHAKPWYVRFRNTLSNDPTNYFVGRNSDLYLPQYRYRLFVDPDSKKDGKLKVIYGEWILDDAASQHPDVVYVADTENLDVTPRNPIVAEHIELIDQLMVRPE